MKSSGSNREDAFIQDEKHINFLKFLDTLNDLGYTCSYQVYLPADISADWRE